jgi:hypothetical protein
MFKLRGFVNVLAVCALALSLVSCGSDMLSYPKVWLQRASFRVDPKANEGRPFVCHIVISYSKDLYNRLAGMENAKDYFASVDALEREYKTAMEIFRFDIIPGKDCLNNKIKVSSYARAEGAFLFVKYETHGRFIENIGKLPIIFVECKEASIEILNSNNIKDVLKKK